MGRTLEFLSATVEEVDFPLVTNFEVPPSAVEVDTDFPLPSNLNGSAGPDKLDAYAWDDFLSMVNDTSSITTMVDVDPTLVFRQLPGTVPDRYSNHYGNRSTSYIPYVEYAKSRNGERIVDLPDLGPWLQMLEDRRKRDLEDWMDINNLDLVVWPAVGDVGLEAAEVSHKAAKPTWRNGIARSFGNAAIRQLGVPTVSVSMGIMNDTRMPIDLTFASKSYDDLALISYAYAFEQAHIGSRLSPPRTPELSTDIIPSVWAKDTSLSIEESPELYAQVYRVDEDNIEIWGSTAMASCGVSDVEVEVFIDGLPVGPLKFDGSLWTVITNASLPFPGVSQFREINIPDTSSSMVVILATASNGRSDGKLFFV